MKFTSFYAFLRALQVFLYKDIVQKNQLCPIQYGKVSGYLLKETHKSRESIALGGVLIISEANIVTCLIKRFAVFEYFVESHRIRSIHTDNPIDFHPVQSCLNNGDWNVDINRNAGCPKMIHRFLTQWDTSTTRNNHPSRLHITYEIFFNT